MMRNLTVLVILAAVAWGGWWVVGSRLLRTAMTDAISTARGGDWIVDIDDLAVSGFPNRFDTRATGVDIASPEGLWGLTIERVESFALSYRPDRLIIVPAPEAVITTPAGPVDVTAGDLRASGVVRLADGGGLASATVAGQDLSIEAGTWTVTLAAGQIATREVGGPLTHDMALSLDGLNMAGLMTDPRLPDQVTQVRADMTLTLDRPLQQGGQLQAIALRDLHVDLGGGTLDLSGDITIGADGLPRGALTLGLTEWRDLLTLAPAFDIPPGQVALLAGGLSGMEDTDGTAVLPLTLAGGQLMFGSIPLAPLPRLPAPYSP
ncbi:DUF2125 domain-containing protein [Jannaschia sp. 2305UL9-9]|uniref:DUF2125 domain-containing protein n=1 Tax=Jannaschia sp. 2305UL9-9 TaxID=3121638 RepID=UPI0035280E7B